METKFEFEVKQPTTSDILFKPTISFRLLQLNPTPMCLTDGEIDLQVDQLVAKVEELRRTAKQKLKGAKAQHAKLLAIKKLKI